MTVLTSYYANIKNIPEEFTLISISGWISDEIRASVDFQDKSLAPSYSIFNDYKRYGDVELYTKRFKEEVLPFTNLKDKFRDYQEYFKNDKFVLLCYEKPEDFCHRHLVADALKEIGIDVKEYKPPEETTSLNDF